MNPTELRDKIRLGETVLGTLIISPSPRWPQAVSACGLDFVFIDTEHIALDRHQLSWMCQAYSALSLPPLVRIASPDPHAASMVLDGGAAGVIAPYIEQVEQARTLSNAVKLRPIKGHKLERMSAGLPVDPILQDYLDAQARQRLLVLNIESVPALESLDQILRVEGIDAVLVGPHDLTCSLEIPEQYDHPRFLDACEFIFKKARAAGVGAGIHFWGSVQQQAQMLALGANLLIYSSDLGIFQQNLQRDIELLCQTAHLKRTDTSGKTVVTI
ncbi:MAG: aldolase [Pirellulaceae bacterium]|nr:aldolase [Pirellulaceae bacterium]